MKPNAATFALNQSAPEAQRAIAPIELTRHRSN
jgi:hypothetical protein